MTYLKTFYLIIFVLLLSCSSEDEHPSLQADFELAQPRFVIGEPIRIDEVTLGAVRYDWDFGNGLVSGDQRPTDIVYEAPGVYTITLTVMAAGGSQTTTQKEVIIGQHHANRLELRSIPQDYQDRNMDIYFTVSEIQTSRGEEIIEEEIYRSEIFTISTVQICR